MSKIKYQQVQGVRIWTLDWAGRELKVEIGKLANQADAACTVRYGDTVVLATTVMAKQPREGIDFFPLLVDFDEKFYAAGKIKGSRFIKREGRPSDEAILSGRIVDRSIRPFFDDSLRHDVQVVITTLSWDGVNDPDTLGVIAAATALAISDIPWQGPVAAVRLCYVGGGWIVNANYDERKDAQLDLLVAVRNQRAVMIEAEGCQAPENLVAEGISQAIKETQGLLELIKAIKEKVGLTKKDWRVELSQAASDRQEEIKQLITSFAKPKIKTALAAADKVSRNTALDQLRLALEEKLKTDTEVTREERSLALAYFDSYLQKAVRELYLKHNQRIDGRGFEEIRALKAEVGLLPRIHGSGLFQRGETQALTTVTLGAPSDEQILDTMEETDTKKRYMHHYNFPGFSVGEVRPNRGPGRREIGHGALAEKALVKLIPDKEEFPYTIRLVTEILSSNGSTSQAAVCGSSLALMDAGVPLAKPVAGVALGLMSDEQNSDNYKILTDIQGLEDHFGAMDLKVAGTDIGITAMQMDVKSNGLTTKMVAEALAQARQARIEILKVLQQAIPEPRKELSPYAPRIYTLKIDPEKIGDVIGPRGKVINEIIDATGVTIDIDDDGLVMITSTDSGAADKAIDWVKDLTREVKPGEVFQGKVVRLMDFGAFVEILPGQDGLVHISELAPWHVGRVEDVVKLGDVIPVKVLEKDPEGRINLSLKQTDYKYPPAVKALADQAPRPVRPSRPGTYNNFRSPQRRLPNSRRPFDRHNQRRRY